MSGAAPLDTERGVRHDAPVTHQAAEPVSIFIIDDTDDRSVWNARLAGAPEVATGRSFAIESDVCPTAKAARARLREMLADGYLPDLVVIDHQLLDHEEGPAQSGLGVMRWLADECEKRGVELPRCVLRSADCEVGLAYAFVSIGGTNAYKNNAPEFVAELWAVHDRGLTWRHPWTGPRLDLPAAHRPVLPYLEANVSTADTARSLRSRGVISDAIADPIAWVTNARGKIQQACNAYSEQHLGTRPFIRGQSGGLAEFASAHGQCWVPLRYRAAAGLDG